MIISGFIPSLYGSAAGSDPLNVPVRQDRADSPEPGFSELLGSSELSGATAPVESSAPSKLRDGTPAPRGMVGTASSSHSGIVRSINSGGGSQSDGKSVFSDDSSAPAMPPSLDAGLPLVSDPRLQDPIELALEAAAIALGGAVVLKSQQPQIPQVVLDEFDVKAWSEMGGMGADEQDVREAEPAEISCTIGVNEVIASQSLVLTNQQIASSLSSGSAAPQKVSIHADSLRAENLVLATPVGPVPERSAAQVTADQLLAGRKLADQVEVEQLVAGRKLADQFEAEQLVAGRKLADQFEAEQLVAGGRHADQFAAEQMVSERNNNSQPAGGSAATFERGASRVVRLYQADPRSGITEARIGSVPEGVAAVVPTVVVRATTSQSEAISSSGSVILRAIGEEFPSRFQVALSTPAGASSEATSNSLVSSGDILATLKSLSFDGIDPQVKPGPASILSPSGEAVAGLGSAVFESSAEAHFARSGVRSSENSQPSVLRDEVGINLVSTDLLMPSGGSAGAENPSLDFSDGGFHAPEFDGKSEEVTSMPPRSKTVTTEDTVFLDSSNLPDPEVGTLGAKENVVQVDTPQIFGSSSESLNGEAEPRDISPAGGESAFVSEAALGSQSDPTRRSGSDISSRPTVLPTVHARASEMLTVVKRALDRARSENPSHLAVEVTLDDGSSFGLEVRMGAGGLQASFRSESQALLKALETGWAGFVAKDSADFKVTSAAFDGRSGAGDFGGDRSGASDRHDQFEDNSAAAQLRGEGTELGSLVSKSKAQGNSGNDSFTNGVALYA